MGFVLGGWWSSNFLKLELACLVGQAVDPVTVRCGGAWESSCSQNTSVPVLKILWT